MTAMPNGKKRRSGPQASALLAALLVSVILEIASLGDFIDEQKPEFAALVLVYYAAVARLRFSIELSLLAGLSIDLLQGAPLGINALALCSQVYLISSQFESFRRYYYWQQALIVGIVNLIVSVTCYWLAHMLGQSAYEANFIIPALLLAVLWLPFRLLVDLAVKPDLSKEGEADGED